MKLSGDWPKARLAELLKVISNLAEMIATSRFCVLNAAPRGKKTLVPEQRSHDILESFVKLDQNRFTLVLDAV